MGIYDHTDDMTQQESRAEKAEAILDEKIKAIISYEGMDIMLSRFETFMLNHDLEDKFKKWLYACIKEEHDL